jgi:hypothetical protein
MKAKLVPLTPFERNFKRLSKKFKSLISEFESLSKQISENPSLGIAMGGGLFKIRLASQSKGKGKSGGFRVVTYYIDETKEVQTVYLVSIYDKSEEENISKAILEELVKKHL